MLTQLCAAQFTTTLERLRFADFSFAEWQGRMRDTRWQITCDAGIAELHVTPSSSCLTRFSANLLFLTAPDGQRRRFGGASKTGASRRRDRLGLERSAGLRVRWKQRSLRSPLSIRRNARLRKPLDGGKTSRLLCGPRRRRFRRRIYSTQNELLLFPYESRDHGRSVRRVSESSNLSDSRRAWVRSCGG